MDSSALDAGGIGATVSRTVHTDIVRRRSGVQVTGSHSLPAHNGLEMVPARQAIHGAQIRALDAAMAEQRAARGAPAAGSLRQNDVFPADSRRIRKGNARALLQRVRPGVSLDSRAS